MTELNLKILILIYDISYNNMIGVKPLLISFDKIDGFFRVYYLFIRTRYLVLFGPEKYGALYNLDILEY